MSLAKALMGAYYQSKDEEREAMLSEETLTSSITRVRQSSLAEAMYDYTSKSYSDDIRDGKIPLHVSSLITFCARKTFLARQRPQKQVYTPNQLIAFAIGKALERFNTNNLIEMYGKQNVFGEWWCKCGDLRITGFGVDPFPKICKKCNTSAFTTYNELNISNGGFIQGTMDFLFRRVFEATLEVVELKTMKGEKFKELTAPVATHIMQAYFYYRLLQDNAQWFLDNFGVKVDAGYFTIKYTNKEYQFYKNPWKDFVIKIESIPESYGDLYDSATKQIKELIDKPSKMPKRECCKTIKDPLAKQCLFAGECFDRDVQ